MKMSKIEEEKAKEIIMAKYPKADFWYDKESGKFNIAFGGVDTKVYSYHCINTLHFLKRLKLVGDNVVYNKDYKAIQNNIEEMKREIEKLKNEKEDSFYFIFNTKEEEIAEQKKGLKKKQEYLDSLIILDI